MDPRVQKKVHPGRVSHRGEEEGAWGHVGVKRVELGWFDEFRGAGKPLVEFGTEFRRPRDCFVVAFAEVLPYGIFPRDFLA
jgi:hypothetical protein